MSTAIINLWHVAYAATAKLLPQSCYCKSAMRARGFLRPQDLREHGQEDKHRARHDVRHQRDHRRRLRHW